MIYGSNQNLFYEMGIAVNFKGEEMKVEVDFGEIWFPAYYEANTNSINVIQDRLTKEDIGNWNITIYASYREINGTTI